MVESHFPFIPVLKRLLNPLIIASTLFLVVVALGRTINADYVTLLILVFLVTSLVYDETGLDHCWRRASFFLHVRDILVGWLIIIAIVLFFAYATGASQHYDRGVILTWFVVTPAAIFASHLFARYVLYRYYFNRGIKRSGVIIGLSSLGIKLSQQLRNNQLIGISVNGFFDDRSVDRLASQQDIQNSGEILGKLSDVAEYVRRNKIEFVYITLPMVSQPRILALFNELRDSTASVYFVPDIFVFDLLHARFGQIDGIPVISIRDTPMVGISGFNKRVMDVIFSIVFIAVLSPLLLLIALGIKVSSPGPVVFRQRRYGLNGEEIVVYKFRSMTVCEDGDNIQQAQKCDVRITPLGSFLRRSSLDELPQLFNVLEGSMSLVGPRPHAVAHNEMYRKMISGYMIRHKVKPGITGWAQVNGFRGETETLEKMRMRLEYDIEYIRNWSIYMDFVIICRTPFTLIRDKNAY